MGWNTQINILIEGLGSEYLEIAEKIYTKDAMHYWGNGVNNILFNNDDLNKKLFITYCRRKHMPYWVLEDISNIYKHAYFTIIAESPDFLGGPSGIAKITNGEIIDSYGFYEKLRCEIVSDNPNIFAIVNWFNKEGKEEILRQKSEYILKQPMKWINEDFFNNLLDFDEKETIGLNEIIIKSKQTPLLNWVDISSKISKA
ncbi:MAG TPA: hypothetical protein DIT04_02290 [Dysgonomonas sp.]|nr:hypothetical protein [Dysgonomonas sp.]